MPGGLVPEMGPRCGGCSGTDAAAVAAIGSGIVSSVGLYRGTENVRRNAGSAGQVRRENHRYPDFE